MLILFRVRLCNKKNPPFLSVLLESAQPISKQQPAVVPAFIQFRLEIREAEILGELSNQLHVDFGSKRSRILDSFLIFNN